MPATRTAPGVPLYFHGKCSWSPTGGPAIRSETWTGRGRRAAEPLNCFGKSWGCPQRSLTSYLLKTEWPGEISAPSSPAIRKPNDNGRDARGVAWEPKRIREPANCRPRRQQKGETSATPTRPLRADLQQHWPQTAGLKCAFCSSTAAFTRDFSLLSRGLPSPWLSLNSCPR